jgi:hypothetical protein
MKCSKGSIALFALLSLSTGALNARDADLTLTVAAAQTSHRQCMNTCRARYRDCQSLKQIPSSECRGVYRDCTRFTCHARVTWTDTPRITTRAVVASHINQHD